MPELEEILPGLHRWTASHPDWGEGDGGAEGWEREVASLAWEGDDALVLIDPLVIDGGWEPIDALAAGHGGPVAIAITCYWHGRSGGEALERYGNSPGASTHALAGSLGRLGFETTHPFSGEADLPGGIKAFESDRGQGEATLWIQSAGALVAGDVLLGAQGERTEALRVCPEDWIHAGSLADVKDQLRKALELDVRAVVPLHGAPVLDGAHEALERALA